MSIAPKLSSLLLLCFALTGCREDGLTEAPATVIDAPASDIEGGALSGGPPTPAEPRTSVLEGSDWPQAELVSGQAVVDCDSAPFLAHDPSGSVLLPGGEPQATRGQPLSDLSYGSVESAVLPCRGTGLVRLHYSGKIAADFTDLVQRVANMAQRHRIDERILQLDSAGGHVEDAMKAGDAIGASRWTIRVDENDSCHSACVLILAAGDYREISGPVGVHRMLRVGSTATTREELTDELREVHSHMKDYLERNGAAVTVADLMMTVPNRKLRLLNQTELLEYGLQGTNAVQDDLVRIQLSRKCGDDFVRRKDDYDRAFSRQCAEPDKDLEAQDACGLALREGFGFPDDRCPVESPLSRLDRDTGRTTGQAGLE